MRAPHLFLMEEPRFEHRYVRHRIVPRSRSVAPRVARVPSSAGSDPAPVERACLRIDATDVAVIQSAREEHSTDLFSGAAGREQMAGSAQWLATPAAAPCWR